MGVAGCAHDDTCRLVAIGHAPLWSVSGRLAVPVFVNRQPIALILDTGSVASLISPQHAETLHLIAAKVKPSAPAMAMQGLGGTQPARVMQAETVMFADLFSASVPFLVPDSVSVRLTNDYPDLLGMSFLGGLDADIDVSRRVLALYKGHGTCVVPPVGMSEPLYHLPIVAEPDDNRPVVMVTVGGQPFRALLDTGAPSSLLFEGAALRLGLTGGVISADPAETLYGIGKRAVSARRHMVTSIVVGGLTISPLRMAISPENDTHMDMVLGMDFLRTVHLWISGSTHSVVLQYPLGGRRRMH